MREPQDVQRFFDPVAETIDYAEKAEESGKSLQELRIELVYASLDPRSRRYG